MHGNRLMLILTALVFGCATTDGPEDGIDAAADFWSEVRAELRLTDGQGPRAQDVPGHPGGGAAAPGKGRSLVGLPPRDLSEMMLDHIVRILEANPHWGATVEQYLDLERERGVRTAEQSVGLRTRFIQHLLMKEKGQ
jgi:hypothetical protein